LEKNLKPLWNAILDGLTFTDLAGHRQPRQYAVVAGVILFIVIALGGMSWVNQLLLKYSMKETYAPIKEKTATPLFPAETVQVTALPCPVLSEQWSLSDPVIKQNYKVIQSGGVFTFAKSVLPTGRVAESRLLGLTARVRPT